MAQAITLAQWNGVAQKGGSGAFQAVSHRYPLGIGGEQGQSRSLAPGRDASACPQSPVWSQQESLGERLEVIGKPVANVKCFLCAKVTECRHLAVT